jgi:hypothetical protein
MRSQEISLNLKNLTDNKISADEAILLYLFGKKDYDSVKEFISSTGLNLTTLCKNLHTKKFLLSSPQLIDLGNPDTILLDKVKTDKTFGIDKDYCRQAFLNLFNTYPLKVPGDNGASRPLRPSNPDSTFGKKLFEKYVKQIGSSEKHQMFVQSVLVAELEMRKAANNLKYMVALEVYLNQKKWEIYEYLLEEETSKTNHVQYGQQVV